MRELRIVGPGTDLRLVVEGRSWVPSDGKHNMPDGEVFTSPVESGTEGEIFFAFPADLPGPRGRERASALRGRSRRPRGGDARRRVPALAARHRLGLEVLGEVAFGLNYEIDRFTRDILFDEKIGGTMHVALGGGFDEAGTENKSELHWDLICDLREEGEVYADGELVWKAGSFLSEPEPAVERV